MNDNETPILLPYRWEIGEHIAVIGKTGEGKTRLMAYILGVRNYIISFKAKADDTKLPGKTVRLNKDLDDPRYTRFVLDPAYFNQRQQFGLAFERIWRENGWTMYIDELFALTQLKLTPFIDRALTQGRSKHISVVTAMQRPVSVTRFAISQATHVIIFNQEGRDLKTVVEVTSPRLAPEIASLKRHEFIWYHVPSRDWWRGRLQELQQLSNTVKEVIDA